MRIDPLFGDHDCSGHAEEEKHDSKEGENHKHKNVPPERTTRDSGRSLGDRARHQVRDRTHQGLGRQFRIFRKTIQWTSCGLDWAFTLGFAPLKYEASACPV